MKFLLPASALMALCLSSCESVEPAPRVPPLVLADMPVEAVNMGDYEILPDYLPPYSVPYTRYYYGERPVAIRTYYPGYNASYLPGTERRIGGPDYENKYN
ncbi:hypothetical protein [Prosthecobacter sp.]